MATSACRAAHPAVEPSGSRCGPRAPPTPSKQLPSRREPRYQRVSRGIERQLKYGRSTKLPWSAPGGPGRCYLRADGTTPAACAAPSSIVPGSRVRDSVPACGAKNCGWPRAVRACSSVSTSSLRQVGYSTGSYVTHAVEHLGSPACLHFGQSLAAKLRRSGGPKARLRSSA